MRCANRFAGSGGLVLLALAFFPAGLTAAPISGDGLLGHYSGTFSYSPTSDTTSTLEIVLTNTSPAAQGGFLTAFLFNNPGNRVTGVSLLSTDADFDLLGGPPGGDFQDDVNGAPYGQFDIGAGTGGSFEGGGSPNVGMAVGATETFTFSLTGIKLDGLTEGDFFSELSVPPGDGGGLQWFVARFRGFDNPQGPDSDKVIPNPEPGTLLLAATGLLGLCGYGWRRRQM